MPYINATVTVRLHHDDREAIKKELGKIIALIPGKSEEWLMVAFKEDHSIYFRGEHKDRAAFINIKIMGAAERKYKQLVVEKVSKVFEGELMIPQDCIYVVIEEVQDWAWNGSLF